TNSPSTLVPPAKVILPSAPEETLVLENENARYTFTSVGGGLKLVELKHYPATVSCRSKKTTDTNGLATLNTRAPEPVFSLSGSPELETGSGFILTKTGMGIRAEQNLPTGLRLIKTFQLGTNYLLNATVRLENPT